VAVTASALHSQQLSAGSTGHRSTMSTRNSL
jgi:hypothetical protein